MAESIASVEIDGEQIVRVPRALLPSDVQVGDAVTITIARDEAGTREAMEASAAQMRDAPIDQSSGDIAL
jgi:hypothetical protein